MTAGERRHALDVAKSSLRSGVNAVLRRLWDVEMVVVPAGRSDPGIGRLAERIRRPLVLNFGVYDYDTRTLYTVHNRGLFSGLSVTLWSLGDLIARGHLPRRLNFEGGFGHYKDQPESDLVTDLFEPVDPAGLEQIAATPASAFARFDHHGPYEEIDLDAQGLLVSTYLRPNASVTDRAELFRRRDLDPGARYVGAWLRGTDKWNEVAPVDSAIYIDALERVFDRGEADRLLLQTDQAQIRHVVGTWFEDRCDVFGDLPVTSRAEAIFETDIDEGRRVDATRDLLAAASVISGMDHVFTSTSNIGAWLVLMRGSVEGVRQAREGALVPLVPLG